MSENDGQLSATGRHVPKGPSTQIKKEYIPKITVPIQPYPKGPYTAHLRTLVPNTIPGIVFGIRVRKCAVYGRFGIHTPYLGTLDPYVQADHSPRNQVRRRDGSRPTAEGLLLHPMYLY